MKSKSNATCQTCGTEFMTVKSQYCSADCRKHGSLKKRIDTNIARFGVSDPNTIKEIKDKKKSTFISKYGVDNPMKNTDINLKMHDTMKTKYGVTHALQNSKFVGKFNNTMIHRHGGKTSLECSTLKDRIEKTMCERYGAKTIWLSLIDEETHNTINSPEKLSELCKKYSVNQIKELLSISQSVINKKCREYGIETKKFTSSLENEILEFLDLHKISYQTHKRDIIYPFEIDIYMPDYNLAIECNGSYWHSELNGKDRNYHLNKTIKSQARGINLIHIWEHEWYQKKDIVKSMLLSRINKATKIYARNCQIAPVETEQEKEFLNNNHIQGYITSFKSIGLYLDNNLVSLMSFGKSRFSKNYEYELLRFCNKADMSVVGGSSKLFQHFVKSAQATSIISYSHRGKFTGNMYKQLGFEYSHSSLPAYYYTQDYETFENRIKYQKHKLSKLLENFDINKTEWQNMQTNGYDRIWDCGNDVWTWSKND